MTLMCSYEKILTHKCFCIISLLLYLHHQRVFDETRWKNKDELYKSTGDKLEDTKTKAGETQVEMWRWRQKNIDHRRTRSCRCRHHLLVCRILTLERAFLSSASLDFQMKLLSSRAYREEARLNLVLTNRHNQSYHSHKRTIKKNSSYFIINKWAIFIMIAALSSGKDDITEVFQTVALHLDVAQGSATLRAHALLTRQSLSSSAVKHQLKMNIMFYSVRL